MKKIYLLAATLVMLAMFSTLVAQSGRRRTEPKKPEPTTQTPEAKESNEVVNTQTLENGGETIEDDVVRFNTSLVTVPVTVMDRNGHYVPQLQRGDFHIFENGVEQKIAYFATTDTPFTIVFVIDTSGSTESRLREMQDSCLQFVDRLKPEDSVMVISFDDRIDVLTKATSDRAAINSAIRRINGGGGTRLYDAVDEVLKKHLSKITGRKAVVLFTDGMDTTSHRASYDSTIRLAEESDAPIYSVDYSSAFGGAGGTLGSPGGVWGSGSPTIRMPRTQTGGGTLGDPRRASAYLHALSNTTGGRYYSGNSMFGITQAFSWIAEELGRQYSLGYYPQKSVAKGDRRQIKVKVDEAGAVVKARDSYIYAEKRPGGEKEKPVEKQQYISDVR